MQETNEITESKELSEEFSKMLRHLRKSNNLSYAKLAKLVNVSPSYIFRLESMERRNPGAKLTLKLAKALNANFETLLTKDMNSQIEKAEMQDFATLLIMNDFTVNEHLVSDDVKEHLINIIEVLFELAVAKIPRKDFFHRFVSAYDNFEAELQKGA